MARAFPANVSHVSNIKTERRVESGVDIEKKSEGEPEE